jgi:hypothetical protein
MNIMFAFRTRQSEKNADKVQFIGDQKQNLRLVIKKKSS